MSEYLRDIHYVCLQFQSNLFPTVLNEFPVFKEGEDNINQIWNA